MSIWEKLITRPDWGPRTGSPLAREALGLCALYFALHSIHTGVIPMNKSSSIFYMHFADHPIEVSLTCIAALVSAACGLSDARARYRMHDQ